jgi:hypothetical protein
MNTLQIDIVDQSLYETVMKFLNQFPKNAIKIKSENRVKKSPSERHFKSISIQTKKHHFDRDAAHAR